MPGPRNAVAAQCPDIQTTMAGFRIADFFPSYAHAEKDASWTVYRKREFYDHRLPAVEKLPSPGERGRLMEHQKIMRLLLGPRTPYAGMLLFHRMGTGKTCSAVAVLEEARASGRFRGGLVLTRSSELADNFALEMGTRCTAGNFLPDSWREMPQSALAKAIQRAAAPWYTFETLGELESRMKKAGPYVVARLFRNHVVVVDEAHNLRPVEGPFDSADGGLLGGSRESQRKRYELFHRFLHFLKESKILLLTGTPMRNDASEMATLMNLILPEEQQLPTGDAFTKKYVRPVSMGFLKQMNELASLFDGKVSYLSAMPSEVREEYVAKGPQPRLGARKARFGIPLYVSAMKGVQLTKYMGVEVASKKKQFGGKGDLKAASNMVFPDGSYSIRDVKDKYIVDRFRKKTFSRSMLDYLYKKGSALDDVLGQVSQLSCKYAAALREVMGNPSQKCFLYSDSVEGGGLLSVALLLQTLGFARYTKGGLVTKKERYAIITGERSKDLAGALAQFNRQDNAQGEYLRVILGSKVVGEGFTLKDVQQIHILTPFWNFAPIDQAMKRVVRLASHIHLRQRMQEVVVRIFLHASNAAPAGEPPRSNDIDMYEKSYQKDVLIKSMENLLKRAAIDCLLFKRRNVRDSDADLGRECEYKACNYKCFGEHSDPMDLERTELDTSTYFSFHSAREQKRAREGVVSSLQKNYALDLPGVENLASSDWVSGVTLSALDTETSSMVPVYTPYGAPTYVAEDKNVYYLSQFPEGPSWTDWWYAANPWLVSKITPTEAVDLVIEKEDPLVAEKVVSFLKAGEDEKLHTYLSMLPKSSQQNLLECIVPEYALDTGPVSQILSYYRPYLYFLDSGFQKHLAQKAELFGEDGVSYDASTGRWFVRKHDVWTDSGRVPRGTWASTVLGDDKARGYWLAEGGWKNAPELGNQIRQVQRHELSRMMRSSYGMMGVFITATRKFKLLDTSLFLDSFSGKDRRRVPTGVVCGTGEASVPRLLDIVVSNGITPKNPPPKLSREGVLGILSSSSSRKTLRGMRLRMNDLSSQEKENLAAWMLSKSAASLCESIRRFLEKRRLVATFADDGQARERLYLMMTKNG